MLFRKKGVFLAICLFTSLLAFGLIAFGSRNTNGASEDAEFRHQVRNAIAEIGFPSATDPGTIETVTGNLSHFMSYRAGVLVSDANEGRLSSAEQLGMTRGKRISRADLAEILTDLASVKLRDLTDGQKSHVVESLRGFDDPNLPGSFRQGRDYVSLRASGKGRMTVEAFSARLDSVRGENAESKLVRSLIRNSIALEIGQICDVLYDASPDLFGGTKCDMTALQALLVSYAVITDDPLAGNQADLNSKMLKIRGGIEEKFGVDYPDPQGHTAYGPNGYIFSSPADLLLDGTSIKSLISKIEEKLN